MTFSRLDSTVQQRITDLEVAASRVTVFAVGLDADGAEATLATNGPLEFFVRCIINDGGSDRIFHMATSTQAGWFSVGDSTGRVAGEEVLLMSNTVPTGSVNFTIVSHFAISAADGSTLTLPINSIGFNAFGHVCTVSGTASAVGAIS